MNKVSKNTSDLPEREQPQDVNKGSWGGGLKKFATGDRYEFSLRSLGELFALCAGIAVAGVAALVLFVDAVDLFVEADSDISDIEHAQYVPALAEGQCLYVDPLTAREVSYKGDERRNVSYMAGLLLPGVERGAIDVVTITGTIPSYSTAPCDTSDNGITNVFQTRADAVRAEIDNAGDIAARLRAAQDQYPHDQVLKFAEISIK